MSISVSMLEMGGEMHKSYVLRYNILSSDSKTLIYINLQCRQQWSCGVASIELYIYHNIQIYEHVFAASLCC